MRPKPVTLRARMNALKSKHRELDYRLRDEMARPMPDALRAQTLKRMRLRTKDQIALVARQLALGPGRHRPEVA